MNVIYYLIYLFLICVPVYSAEQIDSFNGEETKDYYTYNELTETENLREDTSKEWLIVGGKEADIREFPYMAYVITQRGKKKYGCGGAIVDDMHVITAAHCVTSMVGSKKVKVARKKVNVRVGNANNYKGELFPVQTMTVHPLFIGPWKTTEGDLAVLRVGRKFTMGDTVNVVSLPSPEMSFKMAEYQWTGKECSIAGWGRTSNSGHSVTQMRYVLLNIIPTERCHFTWTKLNKIIRNDYHLCTFTEDKDSCFGDSGSPLVCNWGEEPDSKKYAWGVISFGNKCADKEFPAVYTRMDTFYDFVRTTVESDENSSDDDYEANEDIETKAGGVSGLVGNKKPFLTLKKSFIWCDDKDSNIKEFPYVALLVNTDGGHHCTGAVIDTRHVLTAAHCLLSSEDEAAVREKTYVEIGKCNKVKNTLQLKVERVFIHPLFTKSTTDNRTIQGDVAVVRIVGEFPYGPKVQPVALAEPGMAVELEVFKSQGKTCYTVGWVEETRGPMDFVSIMSLRTTKMSLIKNPDCSSRILSWGHKISFDYHICAQKEGDETNELNLGGEGSPLFCDRTPPGSKDRQKYLWAVGSLPRAPGSLVVFTRVDPLYDFINNSCTQDLAGVKSEGPYPWREATLYAITWVSMFYFNCY